MEPRIPRITERHRHGFSLVELSIVLVILGLLVGGILAGKSLMRAAALRSVQADIASIASATHSFRDKYFMLPGDMNNATQFWGKDNAACPADSGTASTPGTCNGNGDGRIGAGFAVQLEVLRAWNQLSRAGLYPGNWPGTPSIAPGQVMAGDNPGVNLPASRYNYGGGMTNYVALAYRLMYAAGSAGDLYNSNDRGNYLYLAGRLNACCGGPYADGGGIVPTDAYNIDMKLDDGRPDIGKVQVKPGWFGGCATANTSPAQYVQTNDETGSGSCPLFINIGIK